MSAMTLPLSTLRLATIAFAIGLALGSTPVSAQEMDHSKLQMPPAATPPPVRKPAVKKPATRKPAAKPAPAAKKERQGDGSGKRGAGGVERGGRRNIKKK